ncbi:hypothetical protein AB0C10_15765 [Microbispora amethystogenes]|uniref:hypothetical protein n=1 Tax=Microbispora amethystogenes TaxID=1427754 RepID=UPI0033E36FC8
MIEADFQSHYGIDLGTPGLLISRSWRWLRTRILGLLSADTRTARQFAPEQEQPDPSAMNGR